MTAKPTNPFHPENAPRYTTTPSEPTPPAAPNDELAKALAILEGAKLAYGIEADDVVLFGAMGKYFTTGHLRTIAAAARRCQEAEAQLAALRDANEPTLMVDGEQIETLRQDRDKALAELARLAAPNAALRTALYAYQDYRSAETSIDMEWFYKKWPDTREMGEAGELEAWLDAKVREALAAQPDAPRAKEPTVVEMRVCEIPWLVLNTGVLYRFSSDPECEKCAAYQSPKAPEPQGDEVAALRQRLRTATQTLVAAIGADAPLNVEAAAERIVQRLHAMTRDRDGWEKMHTDVAVELQESERQLSEARATIAEHGRQLAEANQALGLLSTLKGDFETPRLASEPVVGAQEIHAHVTRQLTEATAANELIHCIHCGHEGPKSDRAAARAHILVCEKHPLNTAVQRIAELEKQLAAARAEAAGAGVQRAVRELEGIERHVRGYRVICGQESSDTLAGIGGMASHVILQVGERIDALRAELPPAAKPEATVPVLADECGADVRLVNYGKCLNKKPCAVHGVDSGPVWQAFEPAPQPDERVERLRRMRLDNGYDERNALFLIRDILCGEAAKPEPVADGGGKVVDRG
jgi:hypothetical protein